MLTRRAGAGACVLVALLLVAGGLVPAPAVADANVARILIIGDSVTQGESGHYTWRYRLWKTLQAERKSVDFVGPRTTLRDDTKDYADPDFDQDHAARWGAFMTVTDGWWDGVHAEDLTQQVVGTSQPDVVINDLGINNLVSQTPTEVVALAATFVADVRAARPHATVVFGQLTQRWLDGVDAYNAALVTMAATLDQVDARVLVAPAPADYTQQADTYDGSHPNSQGEIKIARQFSDVLATIPLPDEPTVQPAYSGAATVSAAPRRAAVRLRFTTPGEATKQAIWKRDLTRRGRWRFVAYVAAGVDHRRVGPLRRHHRYAFRLRAYSGTTASSSYSNVARVRVR